MGKPTFDQINTRLNYDPSTGDFTWKVSESNRVRVGSKAGSKSKSTGYVYIGFDNKLLAAHRLAFVLMTGIWPENLVDHINQVRHDNRWVNLRPATNAENKRNGKLHRDNTSGYMGVTWNKARKKWRSQIRTGLARLHLGLFDTPELAAIAYNEAARKYHGSFATQNIVGGRHRKT